MADTTLLDIGDELVVRVAGFPVGKAQVTEFIEDKALVKLVDFPTVEFRVPLNVKDYEDIDGMGHGAAPLTGLPAEE